MEVLGSIIDFDDRRPEKMRPLPFPVTLLQLRRSWAAKPDLWESLSIVGAFVLLGALASEAITNCAFAIARRHQNARGRRTNEFGSYANCMTHCCKACRGLLLSFHVAAEKVLANRVSKKAFEKALTTAERAPKIRDEESTVRTYAPLFVIAFVFICTGRSFPQSVEKEGAAVLELGGAAGRSLTEGQSSFGPTVAVEITPIEKWLEIEAGVTPLFRRHSTEWSIDLLFKKP